MSKQLLIRVVDPNNVEKIRSLVEELSETVMEEFDDEFVENDNVSFDNQSI